ncbi:MAG TPA: lysine--tRNA ligase, partial [Candidatus Norongarragalinales archaeon]|nr:lysine--tRNA ligase [Candidatus Norongarragalinales archaeon]
DWAAAWALHGVTIEGAGKDHYAAGGSRDVANKVSQEIFDYPHPFNFPYEFFIIGGKKMSTSKGVGVSAKDMGASLPPELLRFIMTRYKPQTAIDFNPEGDTIPRLFSDWDSFSDVYFKKAQSRDPDVPRIFELSQVRGVPKDFFKAPFSFVAFLAQLPGVDLEKAMADYKGSDLTEGEKTELHRRASFSRIWLDLFAPEEAKIRIVEKPDTRLLLPNQKAALKDFADVYENEKPEKHMASIKVLCGKHRIEVSDFFSAAYRIFIGREKGPKLLPFLAALDKKFVINRLRSL